jgi:hypothetical protein
VLVVFILLFVGKGEGMRKPEYPQKTTDPPQVTDKLEENH